MKQPDKSEYFARMGWCACAQCAWIFYDYEEYEQHRCNSQGIPVDDIPYKIRDDSPGSV